MEDKPTSLSSSRSQYLQTILCNNREAHPLQTPTKTDPISSHFFRKKKKKCSHSEYVSYHNRIKLEINYRNGKIPQHLKINNSSRYPKGQRGRLISNLKRAMTQIADVLKIIKQWYDCRPCPKQRDNKRIIQNILSMCLSTATK